MLGVMVMSCDADQDLTRYASALRVPMTIDTLIPRNVEVETRMMVWMVSSEGMEVSLNLVKESLRVRKRALKVLKGEPTSRARRELTVSSSSSDYESSSAESEDSDEWHDFRIIV